MEVNLNQLADALIALRERQGLTQSEAAERTGMPVFTLNKLERRKVARPTFEDMAPLARLYGIDLNQIGALLGVWEVEAQEDDLLPVEAKQMLNRWKQELKTLTPEEATEYLLLAEGVLQVPSTWLRQRRQPEQPNGQPDPRLPSWMRVGRRPG